MYLPVNRGNSSTYIRTLVVNVTLTFGPPSALFPRRPPLLVYYAQLADTFRRENTGAGEQGVALQDMAQVRECLVCAILRHDLDLILQILEPRLVVSAIRELSASIHSACKFTEPEDSGVSVCRHNDFSG
ncbi:hypothetical protein J3458_005037 [Metarhizium acridum]|uniref:uncharacterized protein n=1 Tax=Metarhizium acridum TaxID=92637 RepID=UPI001C6CD6A0|nr:hypothetical protein J3458_005037 [Metarhizium acridum]